MMASTPAAHATGRQRRDGSRPSGNSSGRKSAITAVPGMLIQKPSHAINSPAGSPRCCAVSATIAYDCANAAAAKLRAVRQNIHPITCRGWRPTISAPITANHNIAKKIHTSAGVIGPASDPKRNPRSTNTTYSPARDHAMAEARLRGLRVVAATVVTIRD